MKSVHVDRLAEKLVQGLLGPELLAELEQTAIEATTTTDGVCDTEWNDVERAAEQQPAPDALEGSECNAEPEPSP